MTNEELILQRLDALDAKIDPLIKDRRKWAELRQDLIPLQNQAVQLLIDQLQEVEPGFQLEDLFDLAKRSLRSTRNLIFALKALDNVIDLFNDIEPLLKSAVPKMIEHLDELERKGVFRIVRAMLDVRAKVASSYSPEDIEEIGDGMVAMLKLAKAASQPGVVTFLEKLAAVPAAVNLVEVRKAGPWSMIRAGFNGEVKEGLGVLLALTKAMGKMKIAQ